jgi:hypothetical protein
MIFKFIKKYKTLFLFFCIAVISSYLINFPLSKVPEKFEYGSEVGKYIYDLSIGYIVSYLFFYLVVFLKEESDRQHIIERVSLQVSFLIIDGYSLLDNVFHNARHLKNNFPPSFEEVREACASIDPFVSPVSINGNITTNWQWLLRSKREENLKHIEKIKSLPYIESDLYGLVTKIEDARIHYLATNLIFPKVRVDHFKDGSFMEKDLYDYFLLVGKLEEYANKNFAQFPQHTKLREERIKLYLKEKW